MGTAAQVIVGEGVVALQDAPVVKVERRPGAKAAGVGAARQGPDGASVRFGIAAPCVQGALVALRQVLFRKARKVLVDHARRDEVAILRVPVAEADEAIDDLRAVDAVPANEEVEREFLAVVGKAARPHVVAGVGLAIHQRQLTQAHRPVVHPHDVQRPLEPLVGADRVAAAQARFGEQCEGAHEIGVVAVRARLDGLDEIFADADHAGVLAGVEAHFHLLEGGSFARRARPFRLLGTGTHALPERNGKHEHPKTRLTPLAQGIPRGLENL